MPVKSGATQTWSSTPPYGACQTSGVPGAVAKTVFTHGSSGPR